MMEKIDALGQVCPIPVIRSKKALREFDAIEILVDNKVATENLEKMAKQLGYQYECEKEADRRYVVKIDKAGAPTPVQSVGGEEETTASVSSAYTLVFSSNRMGESLPGHEEFAETLMKGFVSSILEQDVLPSEIIFYNSGVFLALEDADTLEDLKVLEDKGVAIFSCGLCLNYYEVADKLGVGTITNMFAINTMMHEANRLVKP